MSRCSDKGWIGLLLDELPVTCTHGEYPLARPVVVLYFPTCFDFEPLGLVHQWDAMRSRTPAPLVRVGHIWSKGGICAAHEFANIQDRYRTVQQFLKRWSMMVLIQGCGET
jgi:hypothetical protein